MRAYTEMTRQQLIEMVEKLTLASVSLRITLQTIYAAIADGEEFKPDEVEAISEALDKAEELAPFEHAEAMAETPTNQTTASLARIVGGYSNTGAFIPGILH